MPVCWTEAWVASILWPITYALLHSHCPSKSILSSNTSRTGWQRLGETTEPEAARANISEMKSRSIIRQLNNNRIIYISLNMCFLKEWDNAICAAVQTLRLCAPGKVLFPWIVKLLLWFVFSCALKSKSMLALTECVVLTCSERLNNTSTPLSNICTITESRE